MPSFREAVLAQSSVNPMIGPMSSGYFFGGAGGHSGSTPTPFDAVPGNQLVGPQGSHPLAALSIEELVRRSSDGLDGEITIDNPDAIRIGDGITGHVRVTARKNISARGAFLRLVGARIVEDRESREDRDSKGNVTNSESWVEVHGKLFDEEAFTDFPLPPSMTAGQQFESAFTIPAPRLGPVTAHVGVAAIAWAIETRWDISMGGDERLAVPVTVHQNLDYLRSGAVRLESGAMFDAWTQGDATIAVKPLPPIAAGSQIEVTVTWPSAGSGRGGRLELQANVDAPNGMKGIVLSSTAVDPQVFRGGTTFQVQVPADAPPTMADQGVAINYRLRALVDRQFRSDLAIERALAVV